MASITNRDGNLQGLPDVVNESCEPKN